MGRMWPECNLNTLLTEISNAVTSFFEDTTWGVNTTEGIQGHTTRGDRSENF